MSLKSILNVGCMALAGLAIAPSAVADIYPGKPVRIIVPYGTGGGSDTLARQLGVSLQQLWGQGVAVDNRILRSGTAPLASRATAFER